MRHSPFTAVYDACVLYPAPGLALPDPNDHHVLAAAIRCKAEVIVTFNLKDFPVSTLEAFDIEPQHPDEFIIDLWDLDMPPSSLRFSDKEQP
jgi:hypothetical protein